MLFLGSISGFALLGGLEGISQIRNIGGQSRQFVRIPRQWLGLHGSDHAELDHFVEMDRLDAALLLGHHDLMWVWLGEARLEGAKISMAGVAGHAICAEVGVLE